MSAPSPAPLLLRSARLTTGETADVLVAEGRIAALGPDAATHAAIRRSASSAASRSRLPPASTPWSSCWP